MEEDNNNGGNAAPDSGTVQENAASCAETEISTAPAAGQSRPSIRKNGRNRSGGGASKRAPSASESCGELNNVAEFKEKLSGSNVSGYGDGEGQWRGGDSPKGRRHSDRREKFGRRDRRGGGFSNENSSVEGAEAPVSGESEAEGASVEHNGPAFETQSETSAPLEVRLHDRRMRGGSRAPKTDDGVISYSATECSCPSISLFERIKNVVASLFGKKDSKKRKFSNSKKGYRGGRDGKKFNRADKKRFDGNRRSNGGKFSNKSRNFRKHSRDGGSASAPKAD